jgi:hypothetical protein
MKSQPEVLYKVVKKRTRYSAVINGSSKYAIKYDKGKEVNARPETFGIMAFTDLEHAEEFRRWGIGFHNLKTIKIKPTSKVKTIGKICKVWGNTSAILNSFYKKQGKKKMQAPPHGTVVCESAIVLT